MYNVLYSITTIVILAISLTAQENPKQDININGKVNDSKGTAISNAQVKLKNAGLSSTTNSDGEFTLVYKAPTYINQNTLLSPHAPKAYIQKGKLAIQSSQSTDITVSIFSLHGTRLSTFNKLLKSGTQVVTLPKVEAGIVFIGIQSTNHKFFLKGISNGENYYSGSANISGFHAPSSLAKTSAADDSFSDTIQVTKDGYMDYNMAITAANTSGVVIKLKEKNSLPKFSFFLTSLKSMRELAGSENGFGGDLRYGETGPGAGLRGADKICAAVAEKSMPGSSAKEWRAFLSVTADENGQQVNAIDRIGDGPWYDRIGRIMSNTKEELLKDRPAGADPQIKNDLPNEFGVPNHDPDGTGKVDNHHFLTGSNTKGKLYGKTSTCNDWTSTEKSAGRPRIGFSWPASRRVNWISGQDEGGCGAGVNTRETGGSNPKNPIVGSGGGYGGIYCFALQP